MLDRNYVSQNTDEVRRRLTGRGVETVALLDGFEELDAKRKAAVTHAENLRSRKNEINDEIPIRKKQNLSIDEILAEAKTLAQDIKDADIEVRLLDRLVDDVLESLPNLPHESVPTGKSEEGNIVIKTWDPDNGERYTLEGIFHVIETGWKREWDEHVERMEILRQDTVRIHLDIVQAERGNPDPKLTLKTFEKMWGWLEEPALSQMRELSHK